MLCNLNFNKTVNTHFARVILYIVIDRAKMYSLPVYLCTFTVGLNKYDTFTGECVCVCGVRSRAHFYLPWHFVAGPIRNLHCNDNCNENILDPCEMEKFNGINIRNKFKWQI